MKRDLPISIFFILLFGTAFAQNDRFAYAVTDLTKDGSSWNALRKLDLQTGAYSDIIFNGTNKQTAAFDAVSKKQVAVKEDTRFGNLLQAPFSTGVAAVAFDKKHNRLYFTPMFIDQLRYIDLSTMKLYEVTDQTFTGLGNMHNDEAKCITRMAIAPDGFGYALSNDGNTFIKFSTGKKPKITQLGSLVDDAANKTVSVHNRSSSFGGDMIADDRGNLYIISARNYVFKVSIDTKVAALQGEISGLPAKFTVNGAVVDAEGSLLVSSAVDGSSYYVVDAKSWKALPYKAAPVIFRSSDLANSNYLTFSPKTPSIETVAARLPAITNLVQIYPNPIVGRQFTLQFSKVPMGDYTVQITDIMGRTVQEKRVLVNAENQTQTIPVTAANAKGVYLVKVIDKEKKSLFEQKVMMQ